MDTHPDVCMYIYTLKKPARQFSVARSWEKWALSSASGFQYVGWQPPFWNLGRLFWTGIFTVHRLIVLSVLRSADHILIFQGLL